MASTGKRKRDATAAAAALAPAVAEPGPVLSEGMLQFKKAVQELKNKAQTKITALTGLADLHYAECEQVAQILTEEIAGAVTSRIQPLVSVMDSVLKKVGKDYRQHLAARLPACMQAVYSRTEAIMHDWLGKMLELSWRKHDLLPLDVL
eukprot:CAMPEP_0203910466 /NCGR_PEP_ID=MMETSP0359-20131031/51700_1 /ASSEMBLY_ACC=CAM_ASM_000338 /TAXON_ID=268821 /ORGANISM="Scrippsiella Hangoei, Strain SHTV-5" /LENGTH=148 /DNA_ID=CAMNT_0050835947 /DNA_START=84 /DNA_END=526 /DNA_ORIENTATION=-